jgi:hypothetical protein
MTEIGHGAGSPLVLLKPADHQDNEPEASNPERYRPDRGPGEEGNAPDSGDETSWWWTHRYFPIVQVKARGTRGITRFYRR